MPSPRLRKTVTVSGYATLDYVIHIAEPFTGSGTVAGQMGTAGAWPRAGGAVLYASRRIAQAGHRSFALSWIGHDSDGGLYLSALRRANIDCSAIDQRHALQTPRCLLIYQPSGEYGCILDAGRQEPRLLTSAQQEAVKEADHICITAGPAEVTAQILDICQGNQELSWIVKADQQSFSPELRLKLVERADLIFCNSSERAFFASASANVSKRPIVIETRGSAGVLIDGPNGQNALAVQALAVNDTTGAGDTFAGEVIAQLVSGGVTLVEAVELALAAAADLLRLRMQD